VKKPFNYRAYVTYRYIIDISTINSGYLKILEKQLSELGSYHFAERKAIGCGLDMFHPMHQLDE
jgi:hypothetical protein